MPRIATECHGPPRGHHGGGFMDGEVNGGGDDGALGADEEPIFFWRVAVFDVKFNIVSAVGRPSVRAVRVGTGKQPRFKTDNTGLNYIQIDRLEFDVPLFYV